MEKGQQPAPSAPPLEPIGGYEGLGFDASFAPPPSYDDATGNLKPPERQNIANINVLSEEQVRDALKEFVSQHCCYGRKPAENAKIEGIDSNCIYHYKLVSYAEKRQTSWKSEPYLGGFIDGPMNGPAPGPWDIAVPEVPAPYEKRVFTIHVPHTASVRMCSKCNGVGRYCCFHCSGNGRDQCMMCRGSGHERHADGERKRCFHCNGNGYKPCMHCQGTGYQKCSQCKGSGQEKVFIQLKIIFDNHVSEAVVDPSERSTLPHDLIKKSSGEIVFSEDLQRAWPIRNFPNKKIVNESEKFVKTHGEKLANERIIRQNQTINMVPLHRISCRYKEDSRTFFVYGHDQNVYFPDYYQKCCCTIM